MLRFEQLSLVLVKEKPAKDKCKRGAGKEEGKEKEEQRHRTLLHDVSGSLNAGQLVALVGRSGSGKTTLLNFLSNRLHARDGPVPQALLSRGWRSYLSWILSWCKGDRLYRSGRVLIHDEAQSFSYYAERCAYVPQDPVLLPCLTVRESIQFTLELRLRFEQVKDKKLLLNRRVDEILLDLGLMGCAETQIGDSLQRGLSGGQERRASIAVEMCHDPEIIFLDEPTTGLDSGFAEDVMRMIHSLAHAKPDAHRPRNRLIICSIHQPSATIFGMFDQLIAMHKGAIMYQGKANKAASVLAQEIGESALPRQNQPEFIVEAIMKKHERKETKRESKHEKEEEEEPPKDEETKEVKRDVRKRETKESVSVALPSGHSRVRRYVTKPDRCTELGVLTRRSWITFLRTPLLMPAKILQTLVLGLLLGAVCFQMGNEQISVQNRFGLMYFLLICLVFANSMHVVLSFADERKVFLREQANELYSVGSYFLSKTIVSIPTVFGFTVVFAMIVYCMTGLVLTWTKVLYFNFILLLVSYIGEGIGLVIGALCPTRMLAVIMAPSAIAPTILFSRYAIPLANIPWYFIPLQTISPFWWGFDALIANEFTNLPIQCSLGQEYIIPTSLPHAQQSICRWSSGNAVLEYYDIDPTGIPFSLFMLGVLCVFYRLVAFACLYYFSSRVRIKTH